MHREANEECLQPEAVRRARIDQPEAADRSLGTEDRLLQPRHAIGSGQTNDRRFDARTRLPPRKGLAIEVSPAHTGEEHATDPTQDTDWRQHRFDERKTQLGVRKRGLRAEELEILIAAQLGVAAEVDEVRDLAPALETAKSQRQQPCRTKTRVMPDIRVDRLTREETTNRRRGFVRQAHRPT